MSRLSILLTIAAAMAFATAVHAGERAKADVQCKATGKKLVYDCMIMLKGKKSGKPLENASIRIKADMPSMAMAHNVKPVKAMAMGEPGQYHATLKLAMHGEWALTMDISGPTRDRIITKLQFGEMVGDGKMEMKHKK